MFRIPFLDLPPLQRASGTVQLPGSKSISNRVLLLAALSQGRTVVHDLLDSDDTRVMLDALRELGCGVEATAEGLCIDGLGGRLPPGAQARLFLGNAGTAMRPLTAALALLGGTFELSGVPRMHERPIGDLVDALRALGCQIDYLGNPGYPPLRIGPPDAAVHALGGRAIAVRGDVSSQFLTALLMALPLVAQQQDVSVEVVGELISKPYIEITLKLLARFGIDVRRDEWRRFVIPAGSQYRSPGEIHVEADASSASYFVALGAIAAEAPGAIRIQGVGHDSIQGDIRFVEAAQAMGARVESGPNWLSVARGAWPLKAIDLDCNHIPDAAMTLAMMALYADGPSTLRNIASWRVKETDRIDAMAAELRKLGATVEDGPDFIRVFPLPAGRWQPAAIHTYDDHRIAMCFSLAAFNPDGRVLRILDPQCVAKTFPDYFEMLFSVAQTQQENIPVICIDGPTASGKGTLTTQVAARLGYHHLDSGSLYRLTALVALRQGIDLQDGAALGAIARGLPVRFQGDSILLNGEDVSNAIREENVGNTASRISALPEVRQGLYELQHAFRRLPGLVADGRDMGTVIFPQAPLKVFLTASAAHRADRRYKQLISKGIPARLEDLRADLEARDARDTQRSDAPLKPAREAILLDNSELTVEQSVSRVLEWWQARQPAAFQ
ncbi:MAG: bifunctional 3-phosphoshikimate 1-carboxyvinyltransferase/cytidylate kinase [Comamonas sp.]